MTLWECRHPEILIEKCHTHLSRKCTVRGLEEVLDAASRNTWPWLSSYHPKVRRDVVYWCGRDDDPEQSVLKSMLDLTSTKYLQLGLISDTEKDLTSESPPAWDQEVCASHERVTAFRRSLLQELGLAHWRIFDRAPPPHPLDSEDEDDDD
eukprot:PhM_4_TR10421/c1_g2_i4/m.25272